MLTLRAVVVMCAAVAASGCGGAGALDESGGEGATIGTTRNMKLIPAPRGTLVASPAWVAETRTLVAAATSLRRRPGQVESSLVAATVPEGPLETLAVVPPPGCRHAGFDSPRALADGRVAAISRCLDLERALDRTVQLVAITLRDLRSRPLFDAFLPYGTRSVALAPDGTQAVINDGRGLEERLWLVTAAGLTRLDVGLARAGDPSWAPDGDLLALDGVRDDASTEGPPRAELPRGLYVYSFVDHRITVIEEGLQESWQPAWSPRSDRLVAALRPLGAPAGLWTVDVTSRKRRLVAAGDDFGAATWLGPNRIAAAVGTVSLTGDAPERSGIALIALDERSE